MKYHLIYCEEVHQEIESAYLDYEQTNRTR